MESFVQSQSKYSRLLLISPQAHKTEAKILAPLGNSQSPDPLIFLNSFDTFY